MEKVRALTRHIRNVEDNCLLLGEKLILNGEIDLGHHLIANGFVHDASKFSGIEWEYLSIISSKEEETKLKLKMAISNHRKTNPHHVEFWSGGIENMPDVYLAEMICDIKARSEEFGTSLIDYIEECSSKKWNIEKDSKTYKRILEFAGLLCKTPFQEIK
jgi:hypothetical protein